MELHGIHHITAITADARANLDFYVRVLGLRFVKKTVNFDDPTAYHLYFGDDTGSPGSILTFFEYPGVPAGRAGEGMIHRISWRVNSEEALGFWDDRLRAQGLRAEREQGRLRFHDPEGLGLELMVPAGSEAAQPRLAATSSGVPAEFALGGFAGVRAYAREPRGSAAALEQTLGFTTIDGGGVDWRIAGGGRSATYAYDPAPAPVPLSGAGTVHHIAWGVRDDEQRAWRRRVVEGELHATQIIDRTYFRSVYFREPSGVLFELATLGPGFAVDEPVERLGQELRLPPQHEYLRPRLERLLAPLDVPERRAA
jgi:glyoxalase family protein